MGSSYQLSLPSNCSHIGGVRFGPRPLRSSHSCSSSGAVYSSFHGLKHHFDVRRADARTLGLGGSVLDPRIAEQSAALVSFRSASYWCVFPGEVLRNRLDSFVARLLRNAKRQARLVARLFPDKIGRAHV